MKKLNLTFTITLSFFISSLAFAECIDVEPVGDGWGMNGDQKCRLRRTRQGIVNPPNIELLSLTTSRIGSESARIEAKFSKPAKVTLKFGETTKLGISGPYKGFLFLEEYKENLTNLKPNTEYYYQLTAVSKNRRFKIQSEVTKFRTLPSIVTTTTAPSTTTTTTNPPTTTSTTTTSSTTISSTTTSSTTPPFEVEIINHGRQWGCNSGMWTLDNQRLDRGAVAIPFKNWGNGTIHGARLYHIEKATGTYSGGNGGTVKYEIWTNGTSDSPGVKIGETGDIIAGTSRDQWSSKSQAESTYPGAIWSQHSETGTALEKFRLIDMNVSGLTKGGNYWLVVRQTNSNLQNYISINNYRSREAPFTEDPNYTHPRHEIQQWTGTAWVTQDQKTPIIELVDSDGFSFGRPWMGEPSQTNSENPLWSNYRLYGIGKEGWRIREKFIAPKTMQIGEVHLHAGRLADSGSITVHLKNSAGDTLESKTFPNFPDANYKGSLSLNDGSRTLFRMRSVDFPTRPTITAGQTYYLELQASTEHLVGSCRDGANSNYFSGDSSWYLGFPEGNMQVFNGSTWKNAYNNTGVNDDTDVDMYFTEWDPGH